ncbi:MAG TPA: hypothetical protein VH540_26490 [Ktedonobacterales bacterium]
MGVEDVAAISSAPLIRQADRVSDPTNTNRLNGQRASGAEQLRRAIAHLLINVDCAVLDDRVLWLERHDGPCQDCSCPQRSLPGCLAEQVGHFARTEQDPPECACPDQTLEKRASSQALHWSLLLLLSGSSSRRQRWSWFRQRGKRVQCHRP